MSIIVLREYVKRMAGKIMQEYELKVLEQYDIEVLSTRKTRGAVLCDTDRGLMLFKEVNVSQGRIPALAALHEYLNSQGMERTDRLVPTKEGSYLAALEDGKQYILKHWYSGRECDVKRPVEILAASRNLAKLHLVMKHPLEHPVSAGISLVDEYQRHNREMKKVRRFVRKETAKSAFEFAFLQNFEKMYEWADRALTELENSDYKSLYRESIDGFCMTHGEYNYHNILMLPEEKNYKRDPHRIAVTNFEKFKRGIQVEDLYYFLRKVMEKSGWKIRLGDNMINSYSAIKPITEREFEYLKIRTIYPEKFWKVADSYYRSNKAWISSKKIEKLDTAIRQTEEKRRFLEEIFAFHL